MLKYYHNARFLTQDLALPVADNLLVDNHGRIVGLNTPAPFDAQMIDLEGVVVAPAFIDPHIHIWKVGDLLTYMLDLRGVRSVAEMQDRLADFARENPARHWILARGFNEAHFEEKNIPTRHDLDVVLNDRPCFVIRTCAHIAVANTPAMQLAQITQHTPVPVGGEIRTARDGQPNGILTETALGLVQKHIPAPTQQAYRDMVLAAQDALLAKGIAAATDPAVMPDLLATYLQLEREGALKIHINACPIRVPDGGTEALPLPEPHQGPMLTVNTVKFFADGGISGKTAAVYQAYKNTKEHGVLRLNHDFFLPLAQAAQDAGFRVATHAIGDHAIDVVVGVYEILQKSNPNGLRHRIEHLGLPSGENLVKMRDMGTFCVSQPIFLRELGMNFQQYLPDEYLRRIYPYRTILDAGVSLAFSSDAPVVRDFDPRSGIACAVHRHNNLAPHEAISPDEALRAYTATAAEANADPLRGVFKSGTLFEYVVHPFG